MTLRLRALPATIFLLTLLAPPGLFAQWRKITGVPNTFYNEVYFTSRSTGWVTTQGATVLRTTDGGSTWQSSTLPGATISANRDLCFLNASVGFVSGQDSLWKTTNGGVSWVGIGPPARRTGSAVAWFADVNNGVLGVGDCADTTITFYRTTDGGTNWSSVTYSASPSGTAVGGITHVSGVYTVACEGGKFYTSTDGGASWSYSNTGSSGWQEDLIAIGTALYIASANGTACGTAGGGVVLRSFNGGASWASSAFSGIVMWGVTMYSSTNGWACGDGGRAFKTLDGGGTWTEASCGLPQTDAVDDIYFVDSTTGWAVGSGIYKFVGDSARVVVDTVNFGDVVIRSWRDSSAALRSLGGNVSVASRALLGRDSLSYIATSGLGTQVVPSCQQLPTPIRFLPQSEGIKTARLEYRVTGFSNPFVVVLIGRGVRPRIYADSVLGLDTIVCTDRVLDSIPVENQGSYSLVVSAIAVSGMSASGFEYVGPSLPLTIPVATRRYLVFRAVSRGSGLMTGTATLTTNEPDSSRSPWRIHLRSFVQDVRISLSLPNPIIIPGGSPGRACVTYTNAGNAPQTIQDITALSPDPAIRLVSPVGRVTLAPGDSVEICFEASAGDTALHQRRFRIRTLPCVLDTTLTLQFRALAPVATAPNSLALRSQCGVSTVDSLRVSNIGNAPLIVGGPVIIGPDAGEFTLVSPAPTADTIRMGDFRQLVIRFTPGNPALLRPRMAELVIPTNDRLLSGGALRVSLTGTITLTRVRTDLDTVDLGEICLGDWSRTVALPIYNDGTASAYALILAPDTSLHSFDGTLPTLPFMAGARDSIGLRIRPSRTGRLVMPMIIRGGPCNLTDTVVMIAQVVGPSWSQPPTISIGQIRVGVEGRGDVRLYNADADSVRIDRVEITPQVSGFVVVAPSTPFVIPTGGFRDVTVSYRPDDTGAARAMLRVFVDGLCRRADSTVLLAEGTRASVTSVRSSIDLGELSPCDSMSAAEDTVRLTNGGPGPVDLLSIALLDGRSFQVRSAPSTPLSIPPGGDVTIVVATTPALRGLVVDSLICLIDQPESPRIAIALHASRATVASSLLDTFGAPVVSVNFGPLLVCASDTTINIRLKNEGDGADTFSLQIVGGAYRLGSPATISLDAGETYEVAIIASGVDAERMAELVVRSVRCERELRVPVISTVLRVGAIIEASVSSPFVAGVPVSMVATIENTGDVELIVNSLAIVDPYSELSLERDYSGRTVSVGDSLVVTIVGTPTVTGSRSIAVVARLAGGCTIDDSVSIPFTVLAPNERPILRIAGSTTIARWGTMASIPIAVANVESALVAELHMQFEVDPDLVDLRGATLGNLDTALWTLDVRHYAPIDGRIAVILRSVKGPQALTSSDTAIRLDAAILRGPEIESSLRIACDSTPASIQVHVDSGRIILEDYCDAHGRRLDAHGSLALEQNEPNPFNPTTMIEFEVPFEGRVVISVFDAAGREVMRPIDGYLPAGRRRVVVVANALPSGVYTYRMAVGAWSLVRRMTLVR